VDYSREDVGQAVRRHTAKRGVDVVVDSVGEATWLTSLRAVARGGRIVTCGATSGPNPKEELRLVFWKHISILGSTMANDREFPRLLQTVAAGRLRPRIDRILPFSEGRRRIRAHGSGTPAREDRPRAGGIRTDWPDGD